MSEDVKRYEGEFLLTKNGNIDFGEIPQDVARFIKRQTGKIRLRIGKQVNGEKGNYGELHINRESRLIQLKAIGYEDARDVAEDIASNYDEIYENGVGLLLRNSNNAMAYICIEPSIEKSGNEFYDIKTISPSNKRYFKNKKRLWKRPQPPVQ
ncbi:MAG: hypothetical protein IKP60_04635 [Treponema sp.]|nr:hypothetical protein [Treponema sp.]